MILYAVVYKMRLNTSNTFPMHSCLEINCRMICRLLICL
jgi:hypothetical protein